MNLKNIVTLLIAMMLTLPVAAQKPTSHHRPTSHQTYSSNSSPKIDMVYGVAAGITCPRVNFSGNDAKVSSSPGLKIGIQWGVDWGLFELVPEFWYSTFGLNFDDGLSNIKGAELKNRSLDMPIMFGVKIFEPLKIHMGPTLSLMCNNDLTTSKGECYEFGRIKGSVGYALGASYKIYNDLFIDLRYVGRFSTNTTEYYGSSSSSDQYNIKMYSIDITIGYRF